MAVLATLPTLDESSVVVRQTGGRDPLRGIQIPGVPAGGPQPAGVAPSAPIMAPSPLDKGKGATSSTSAPVGSGGSKEETRRRLRRADGSLVSDPPEVPENCWWGRGGQLPGPQRAEARQSFGAAATTTATATTAAIAATIAATTTTTAASAAAAAGVAVAPLPGSL
jgi:hypothetical protein